MVVTTRTDDRFIATHLRRAIDEQGVRYIWIAEQLGYSKQRLNGIMAGKQTITEDEGRRIASTIRVPFDLIFELAERSETSAGDTPS